MRNGILIACTIFMVGCLEAQQPSDNERAPARSLLSVQGCTVAKSHGQISVTCADGSSASSGIPALHIQDGNGTDWPNLIYAGNYATYGQIIFNQQSGNSLSYDPNGNLYAITTTFFDSSSCAGQGYAAPPSAVIKGMVYSNSQAWPTGAQALKATGYVSGNTAILSKYESGACSGFSASINRLLKVEGATLDSTDPTSLILPLQLVSQ